MHHEISRTNHLPAFLAVKSCLKQSINLHLEVERKGRGPKSLRQGPGWAWHRDSLTRHSAACVQEMMGDTQNGSERKNTKQLLIWGTPEKKNGGSVYHWKVSENE